MQILVKSMWIVGVCIISLIFAVGWCFAGNNALRVTMDVDKPVYIAGNTM